MTTEERTENNIATLHPTVQTIARRFIQLCKEAEINMVVTSALRTYKEQNDLYEQGRSKAGKRVTNARGGFSNHNFGLAFDVTLFNDKTPIWESPKYREASVLGKALGLSWGGDWKTIKDEPHFEYVPYWAKNLSESNKLTELRQRKGSGKDPLA